MVIAGLIDALHGAERKDAAAVLGALGDAELAAGIAEAVLPVAVVVSDFVLEGSGLGSAGARSSAAPVALAKRALAAETLADPDAVLRGLIRLTDPDVDELLFRDDSGLRSRAWVLRAIVRDRRMDGRPVIAPGVDHFLRQQVFRTERRLAGYDNPHPARIEQLLLDAALWADEPGLVAFALPLGARLWNLAGVARGLQTLRDHGRLDEYWAGGLRKAVAKAAGSQRNHQYTKWHELLEFGDTGSADQLAPMLRRALSTDLLPDPEDADQWTAPGTASRHYALDWDGVLAYAKVVGTGDEETQAAQSTSRGLDEAAAREDMPDEVRVLFEASYPRAVFWTARPDVRTLICLALDERDLNPAARHFGMRELLRRGLLHGSLSAAEVVAYAAPAVEALALAVPTPAGLTTYYLAKGKNSFAPPNVRIPAATEERYQADLRAAVAETIGPDPARWLKVLTRVAAWPDSLAELVAAIDEGEGLPTRRGHRWPRGVDPAAVLLEIAPEGVLEGLSAALADPATAEARALTGVFTRILDRGPVPRRLLEHALGPHGTPAMRLAAARNPAATGGTLWRLADREPAEPAVLAAVYLHPLASRELRVATVVRAEEAGGLHPRLVRRLVTRDAEPGLLLPALESGSPEVLHTVLKRASRVITTDQRIAAYARLAAAAGPEPVWALELERAGTLEKMHEAVRASMAEHSDAPLIAAAADLQTPRPERIAEPWDAAFAPRRPDTAERVRALLDGHPDRWLRLLEPGATLEGLLAELEADAATGKRAEPGEQAEPSEQAEQSERAERSEISARSELSEADPPDPDRP